MTQEELKILRQILKIMLSMLLWIVGAILIFGSIIVGLNFYRDYDYNKNVYGFAKFDHEKWIAAADKGKLGSTNSRCSMYYDLRKNHLRRGMTRTEVEYLLGKIDRYSYCLNKKIKCTRYYFGPCSSSTYIDNVKICFDDQEKVIDFAKGSIKGGINPCDNGYNTAVCHSLNADKCSCILDMKEFGPMEYECKVDQW